MPKDLSNLPLLKYLNLSRNLFGSLPESIANLIKLDGLDLTSCTELQGIPKLPVLNSITEPYKMIPIVQSSSNVFHLLSLKKCIIFGCEKLTEVEGVFKLEPIESFRVEQIKSLFNIDYAESHKVQTLQENKPFPPEITTGKIIGAKLAPDIAPVSVNPVLNPVQTLKPVRTR